MRFARYLLVQVLAYGLDMGGFVLLFTYFGVDLLLANTISKVVAGIFAFCAHRSFTFGLIESGGKIQQALRYFALLALNVPLSALILSALLWVIPMAVAAKFFADVICVFFNYGLSKRFVFLGGSAVKTRTANRGGEQ